MTAGDKRLVGEADQELKVYQNNFLDSRQDTRLLKAVALLPMQAGGQEVQVRGTGRQSFDDYLSQRATDGRH